MATGKVPLYIQLANSIKEYIPSHGLSAGDRLPSVQEMCGLFKVSHATVRAALDLLSKEGVIETRPRQGIFVSSTEMPHNGTPQENVIALLLSGAECAYEAGIIRGVMEQSLSAGYQVIVAGNNSDVRLEAQQLTELSQQVRGLIVFPTHSSGNYAAYAKLLEQRVPWVFIDRAVSGLAASLVATDNEYGGYLATQHLLENGYRTIHAISGKPVTSIQERIRGFRRALKECALPGVSGSVHSSPHYLHTVGYSLTHQILEKRTNNEPIAIFVLDETLALPCYAALKEANVRIPQDVAVVSYDDINARFFDPPLSSIRQDPHRMGREATKMLLDLIVTRKNVTSEKRLKPVLIARNSSDASLPIKWADYSRIYTNESVTSPRSEKRETAGAY